MIYPITNRLGCVSRTVTTPLLSNIQGVPTYVPLNHLMYENQLVPHYNRGLKIVELIV